MFPLIPDLQKELAEYLSIEEIEHLLVNNADIDLEYKVISSDKLWRYLAISKYNFTSSELDSFKEQPIFKALLPLLLNNNKIAVGDSHSLALDIKGKLYSWGNNDFGQLGLSDKKKRIIPTLIKTELTFKAIAAGPYHSLALDNQGKLYAWGDNAQRQLGFGDDKNRNTPTPVTPRLTFRTIAAGTEYSLALDTKGKLYAWGWNGFGQLGLGDYEDRTIPTLINIESTFRTIAAGPNHSLALDNRGKLYAWGDNRKGQLGLGDLKDRKDRTIPTLVTPELTFRTIATVSFYSIAIDTKGKLYAWGWNYNTQLDLNDSEYGKNITIPTPVAQELTFRTIATESYYSLNLDNQGKLYKWSIYKDRNIPTLIKSELTFRTIAVGFFHSLALDTKGKLYAWGSNEEGQLGVGDYKNRNIPILVNLQ
jgi:alpha-tubulin suppressor-like RCC1 family protein